MLTFKQYLEEATEIMPKEHFIDDDNFKGKKISRTIGNHDISVNFTSGNKPYVHYQINNHQLRNKVNMTPSHKMETLHFVKNAVHSYMHHYSPKEISFVANEKEKEPVYKAFSSHLTKALPYEYKPKNNIFGIHHTLKRKNIFQRFFS